MNLAEWNAEQARARWAYDLSFTPCRHCDQPVALNPTVDEDGHYTQARYCAPHDPTLSNVRYLPSRETA